jgi:ribose transport system permease protein
VLGGDRSYDGPVIETRTTWASRAVRLLVALGPLLALLILVAATAVVEAWRVPADQRAFLTVGNVMNILRQAAPVGVVAVGMTFVIISGGIDLSVGAIVLLSGALGLTVMDAGVQREWAGWAIVLSGVTTMLVSGAALGAVNGALITVGRIAPFIATLGTLAAYRSVAKAMADGGEIRASVEPFRSFGSGGIELGQIGGMEIFVPNLVIVFLVVAVLGGVLLRTTTYGLVVRAVGDNTQAARYAALPVKRTLLWTYTLAGLLSGAAGVLISSRMYASVATSSTGEFYELDAIAAVVIGGTRMQGGSGRVWGTVVGVVILAVINNMLNMVGVGSHYQGLVKGAVIVTAVLLQRGGVARP